MGMGMSKIGNWDGMERELNRWEWEGMGMLKAIPAHLYYTVLHYRAGCDPASATHRDSPLEAFGISIVWTNLRKIGWLDKNRKSKVI